LHLHSTLSNAREPHLMKISFEKEE
jgi:hypothetical protein